MVDKRLRYIAYVRKSEERAERQELSHPAQIEHIKRQFGDLNIVKWMDAESQSAFKPGRPIFNAMLKLIKDDKADAIVCWHPNRLSRNEIDSGEVTYLLRSKLKDIKFCQYHFENTIEGIMFLQMIMNQSQYESSKQGKDVKRGMEQKAMMGERPGIVPTGYMKVPVTDDEGSYITHKDKLVTKTQVDPERIELVTKMWTMLLSGNYSGAEIRRIANEEWRYTLRKTPRKGGRPIGLSTIYRMFNNPFYAGYIRHNGELHKGNHQTIISLNDFDYAQKILGKNGKPRQGQFGYAYTGMIRCGKCGCSIVSKTNEKFVKKENRIKTYVHYYCTRKSELRPCNQNKYTSVEKLEEQIDEELAKVTILPEFRDLALEILNRNHKIEVTERSKIYAMQQKRRRQVQVQLDSLIDLRTRDLLDDEEYSRKKAQLKGELMRIDESITGTVKRADNWLELTEKAFNFATYARVHFHNGDLKTKRDILSTLGANFLLTDGILTLEQSKWLVPIAENYPKIEIEYTSRVRTKEKANSKDKEMALAYVSDNWRARRDSNPRHPA
jgi:site-specific DNA recombinase